MLTMSPRLRTWTVATIAAMALGGCARNPVTGKSQLSLVSESQEIEMGRQSAQQVAQQIGLVNDPALQAYVQQVGLKMATTSERPNLPWSFQVVDDPAVNAFALPGGFIFVTRGILNHLNSEAELATVIGHEIGHVTAKHSVSQISRAQVAQIGLGVGMILSEDLRKYGQVAGTGLSLLFLKYGRDAENQADDLGFKYALNTGYDVREMSDVFVTLERVGTSSKQGRLPEWLSTHPNPENRIQKTDERLAALHRDLSNSVGNQEQYMQRINGLTYGLNPRQGFFRNSLFLHPDLKFQIEFPQGWNTQNLTQAVVAVSPDQDAAVQLTLAGQESPNVAARKFLSQEGIKAGRSASEDVNGNPAVSSYFQAQTQEGVVAGLVTFLSYGGNTYQLLAYTPDQKLTQYDGVFRRSLSSFSALRDPQALTVQPNRLVVERAPRIMTLDEFNRQFPSVIPIEELALINQLDDGSSKVVAGQPVKRVVGTQMAGS